MCLLSEGIPQVSWIGSTANTWWMFISSIPPCLAQPKEIGSDQKLLIFLIVPSNYHYLLVSESTVYMKVVKALTDDTLVKGIKKASPAEQTSCLEGFHSVLNQFAPKMIAYSYPGMLCRFVLMSVVWEIHEHNGMAVIVPPIWLR